MAGDTRILILLKMLFSLTCSEIDMKALKLNKTIYYIKVRNNYLHPLSTSEGIVPVLLQASLMYSILPHNVSILQRGQIKTVERISRCC